MAATGAKVLTLRWVEYARRYGVPLQELRETVDEPGRGADCTGRERQPSYLGRGDRDPNLIKGLKRLEALLLVLGILLSRRCVIGDVLLVDFFCDGPTELVSYPI